MVMQEWPELLCNLLGSLKNKDVPADIRGDIYQSYMGWAKSVQLPAPCGPISVVLDPETAIHDQCGGRCQPLSGYAQFEAPNVGALITIFAWSSKLNGYALG